MDIKAFLAGTTIEDEDITLKFFKDVKRGLSGYGFVEIFGFF